MRHVVTALICAFALCLSQGKSTLAQEKPMWLDTPLRDLNNSYIEVTMAEGYDMENARNKAAAEVVKRRSKATGQRVSISINNDQISTVGDDDLEVKARILDEYVEHPGQGMYKVYLLVQTAKNPALTYEHVSVDCNYPFSARVFVPGMAQMYKGSKRKAICLISAETFFVSGIVVAEVLRSSYDSKFHATHNAKHQLYYVDNANACAIARNIAIAGAAAVYVWNVIDGIAAKGSKRLFIEKQFLSNANIQVAPFATHNAAGLTMNINF